MKPWSGISIYAECADLADCAALPRLAASPPSVLARMRPPGRLVNRIDVPQGRLQPDLLRIDPVAPPPRDRIYRTKRAGFRRSREVEAGPRPGRACAARLMIHGTHPR
jgi:hypothetical protein